MGVLEKRPLALRAAISCAMKSHNQTGMHIMQDSRFRYPPFLLPVRKMSGLPPLSLLLAPFRPLCGWRSPRPCTARRTPGYERTVGAGAVSEHARGGAHRMRAGKRNGACKLARPIVCASHCATRAITMSNLGTRGVFWRCKGKRKNNLPHFVLRWGTASWGTARDGRGSKARRY